MDRLIYHNDRIEDAEEVGIAPTLAGLLYGWGIFTTLRIYNRKPFAFDRHWERLEKHAEKARVIIPVSFEQAQKAMADLIAANSLEEGRARITILKGELGAWGGISDRQSDILIYTSAEAVPRPAPFAITISPYRLLSTSLFAGIKRTAMVENLFALEEARSRGFAEAVMLNERGEIVSASAANIFWVQGDEVFTPSLGTGCVAGVTRRFIYEIASEWKLHIVEGGFPIQRLLDAREVFLTSTAREITIVSGFDIKVYNHKEARIAKLINRQLQKLIARK